MKPMAVATYKCRNCGAVFEVEYTCSLLRIVDIAKNLNKEHDCEKTLHTVSMKKMLGIAEMVSARMLP